MGNLDGRIEQDKGPAPEVAGGVKDGPTGVTNTQAPKKNQDEDLDKASDVLHEGDQSADTMPRTP